MRTGPIVTCVLLMVCAASSAQTMDPLRHEAIVEASVETLWQAWTTSAGLESWLAPHAEIDLRVGGTMRANYGADGALGDGRSIENGILSYDPLRMISIQVTQAPEDFPFPNAIYDMWTVLYFEPLGPEQTRVRIVSQGFSPDAESQSMRAYFAVGNAITLRQMQERIAAGHLAQSATHW